MDAQPADADHGSMEQARVQLERVQATYNEVFKKRTADINELRDRMRARAREDHDAIAKVGQNLYDNYQALVERPEGEQAK